MLRTGLDWGRPACLPNLGCEDKGSHLSVSEQPDTYRGLGFHLWVLPRDFQALHFGGELEGSAGDGTQGKWSATELHPQPSGLKLSLLSPGGKKEASALGTWLRVRSRDFPGNDLRVPASLRVSEHLLVGEKGTAMAVRDGSELGSGFELWFHPVHAAYLGNFLLPCVGDVSSSYSWGCVA